MGYSHSKALNTRHNEGQELASKDKPPNPPHPLENLGITNNPESKELNDAHYKGYENGSK